MLSTRERRLHPVHWTHCKWLLVLANDAEPAASVASDIRNSANGIVRYFAAVGRAAAAATDLVVAVVPAQSADGSARVDACGVALE